MTPFPNFSKQRWSRNVMTLAVALLPHVGHAQEVTPNLLDLEFLPPSIAPTQVCVAREPDAVIVAKWENWDGKKLPDMSGASIKRDINRLQQIDARYWLPTIELMITRLADAEPGYAGTNALLARIAAMKEAGAFDELTNQQLVAQLATDTTTLSPRVKNALSSYFRDGIGVPRDIERADTLLVEAGFAGNADALLTLSKMELDGKGLADWDVAPDLAVTMAFGSLVGELDGAICDRAARIAREYHSGEIVRKNPQLAHDWFRFIADLGDPNAAWKIVEYHLKAEGFEKDNEVLIHYLTQASDAGLPFAQIELGRLYETGSLVEQDLDKTLELFRSAATSGLRPGLTRVAQFIEARADLYPDLQQERVDALYKLAELDDVAGWVFTRLADEIYKRDGRWAGNAKAMEYLEKASALGDMDGSINLAINLIANRADPADFDRAVDLLSFSVSSLGGVNGTKLMYGAFMCQAADSPRIQEAEHWRMLEAATATENVEISARNLLALTPETDALTIAKIQSHALYGRATSLASYLLFLENGADAPPEMLAFWEDYSRQYSNVLEAMAKLEFELAQNPEQRNAAFDLLRQEYQRSGAQAALTLAQAMIEYQTNDDLNFNEIMTLLAEPARAGKGAAMHLLASLSQDGRAVYETYADVIEANGDFNALIFAIPFLEPEEQARYMSLAAGIVPCDYKNVMALARISGTIGNTDAVNHWMEIGGYLTGQNTWAMVDLAKTKLEIIGDDAAPQAQALLEKAVALKDESAKWGLFELLVDVEKPTYDPGRAAGMIETAISTAQPADLNGYLGRYRAASDPAKAVIESRLNMPQVFLVAAESGDIYSMRSYAMFLRENASTSEDLAESTQWLERSASGGDTTAMAEFGYALAFGIGTDANLDQALIWLERAAANGSDKAASITSLLKITGDI